MRVGRWLLAVGLALGPAVAVAAPAAAAVASCSAPAYDPSMGGVGAVCTAGGGGTLSDLSGVSGRDVEAWTIGQDGAFDGVAQWCSWPPGSGCAGGSPTTAQSDELTAGTRFVVYDFGACADSGCAQGGVGGADSAYLGGLLSGPVFGGSGGGSGPDAVSAAFGTAGTSLVAYVVLGVGIVVVLALLGVGMVLLQRFGRRATWGA